MILYTDLILAVSEDGIVPTVVTSDWADGEAGETIQPVKCEVYWHIGKILLLSKKFNGL